jgi:hypothetical protein
MRRALLELDRAPQLLPDHLIDHDVFVQIGHQTGRGERFIGVVNTQLLDRLVAQQRHGKSRGRGDIHHHIAAPRIPQSVHGIVGIHRLEHVVDQNGNLTLVQHLERIRKRGGGPVAHIVISGGHFVDGGLGKGRPQ